MIKRTRKAFLFKIFQQRFQICNSDESESSYKGNYVKIRKLTCVSFLIFLFVFSLLSCNNSATPKITFTPETIEVENLPNILFSRSGFNSIDWSREFDFENMNKRVYEYLLNTTYSSVLLKVKQRREDSYGVEYYDSYSVGYLDAKEARRYKDFDAWVNRNNLKEYIERFFVKESDKNSIKINFGPN